MIKLVLEKGYYALIYNDDHCDIVRHRPNRYNFNKLPKNIAIRNQKTDGNIYITEGDITKVYLGRDIWCTMDTADFIRIYSEGYNGLRPHPDDSKPEVRLNKDHCRYSLSHVLYNIKGNLIPLHMNGDHYDYRRSNCKIVPRWLAIVYNKYKFERNDFGSVTKQDYQGKHINRFRITINRRTYNIPVGKGGIKAAREYALKEIMKPILIENNLITEED